MQIKSIDGKILFETSCDNLYRANFHFINLQRAYLPEVNLQGANLQGAYLQGAYLQEANLSGASLQGVSLQGANLQGAYLQEANLSETNLYGANLQGVSLYGANLQGAQFTVSSILHNINWYYLSNELTLELMRRDAIICGEEKMIEWSTGKECPFSKNILRDFYFKERRELYVPGKPILNDLELFKALCKEKNIKHDIP